MSIKSGTGTCPNPSLEIIFNSNVYYVESFTVKDPKGNKLYYEWDPVKQRVVEEFEESE